jgi:Flp pilus assembly protein TadD
MLAAHGLALRAQHKWGAAESALLRALLLEPNDTSTIAALGELYRLSGDAEKCAARYEQVVWQLEQRDPETLGESERRALGEAREHARTCALVARAAKRS